MHRVGLLWSGVSGRYSKVDFHLTGFEVASGIMRKISQNRRQASLDIGVIVHVSSCQCSRGEGRLSMSIPRSPLERAFSGVSAAELLNCGVLYCSVLCCAVCRVGGRVTE